MLNLLTVNFHLTKKCNFRCGFCYAHFEKSNDLSFDSSIAILSELSKAGIRKINFAGGEPLLYKRIGDLLVFAKEIGLVTSIITNGSRITREWVFQYGHYLDILGISCDSSNPETLQLLGRGSGKSTEKTKEVFSFVDEFYSFSGKRIFKKLNSVVTKINYNEDMNTFVESLKLDRWKIFQVLKIEGENDLNFEDYQITGVQFQKFVDRHIHLSRSIQIVPESNYDMTDSYLMINPDGSLYGNTKGILSYSEPILEVGFMAALKQINFSEEKYISRGGVY